MWLTQLFLLVVAIKDGLGGEPYVDINTSSDSERSSLELDIRLEWTIKEAHSLGIDLAAIFDGLDSSGEL